MSFANSILILFLLLAVTVLATATQTTYNTKTQICCNGTVHDKGGLGLVRCCGNEAYDYTHFRCCGCDNPEDVFIRNPFFTVGCFLGRTAVYDLCTQTCCDGEVVVKPDPSVDYGCCHGQLYDKSILRCCGNRLLVKKPGEQCCGDKVYDHESQICCSEYGQDWNDFYRTANYRVAARTNTTSCCGLEIFNFQTHVCCNSVVVPKKEGMDEKKTSACCDGQTYDKTKQFCCRSTGQTGNGTYVYLESVLYDFEVDGNQCCGTSSYDFREGICCGNYTIPKPANVPRDKRLTCCGGQPITDINTQTCINDEILEREDRNFRVCGGKLHDRRTHWCCGQSAYNPQTQMCCGRRLYERRPSLKCCSLAGEVYDVNTHLCCANSVLPLTEEGKSASHDACCSPWYFKFSAVMD